METNLVDAAFPQANGEVVRGKNHLDNLDNDGEKWLISYHWNDLFKESKNFTDNIN